MVLENLYFNIENIQIEIQNRHFTGSNVLNLYSTEETFLNSSRGCLLRLP